MDQFIKVAGTEGKVGGYFCWLPPLNENTGLISNLFPMSLSVLASVRITIQEPVLLKVFILTIMVAILEI